MRQTSGGVISLADKVRARRHRMNNLDIDQIDQLADSWGASFEQFELDATDPVVGTTVLVAAKMLTHRVQTLTEFGHDAADLEPALYVTGEAAMVGLRMLDKSKRSRSTASFAPLIAAASAFVLSTTTMAMMLTGHS